MNDLPPGLTDWLLDHTWALATIVATFVLAFGTVLFFVLA